MRQIRLLGADDLPQALDLVWAVFAAQLAHQCADEGIEEFWRTIDHEYMLHRMGDGTLRFWGAYEGERLVGMCAVRELTHVQLLFVGVDDQRQGAGTALLKKALIDCKALDADISRITVEAMGHSQGFFEAQGFVPLGPAGIEDGMVVTPMALEAL